MKRFFYPVGQGAFYHEKIDDFNFIYDCGGNINQIRKYSNKIDREIDLLVISHFHIDHYKGLEYLISQKNIKAIMFPILNSDMKIINVLNELTDNNDNSEISKFEHIKFVINPMNYIKSISKNTKIIQVLEFEEGLEPERKEEVFGLNQIMEISSGTKLNILGKINNRINDSWIFIPFNLSLKDCKVEKLLEKINEILNLEIPRQELTSDRVLQKIEILLNSSNSTEEKIEFVKKLREIHSKVITMKNEYSLCVYSGFEINSSDWKVGCLYTGDYDAKTKIVELKQAYNNYIEKIGIVQIPHHGSSENYIDDLIFENVRDAVITVGKNGGGYNHPAAEVTKQISLKCKLHVVTEDDKSILRRSSNQI